MLRRKEVNLGAHWRWPQKTWDNGASGLGLQEEKEERGGERKNMLGYIQSIR